MRLSWFTRQIFNCLKWKSNGFILTEGVVALGMLSACLLLFGEVFIQGERQLATELNNLNIYSIQRDVAKGLLMDKPYPSINLKIGTNQYQVIQQKGMIVVKNDRTEDNKTYSWK